jgi:ParB-like nuclease family protein
MLDPKTEAFLMRGGWKYTYLRIVQIKDIDLKASMENPSRLERKLNDDKYLDYAIKMEAGIEFPAIVLLTIDPAEKRPFKYEIATGCHRVEAANTANKKTFDAYVVTEADNYRRETLCRMANTIEGTAPSMRDTLTQICEMHIRYKKPLAELARGWNVKVQALNNFWTEEQAIRRARKYGYDSNRHKVGRKALVALAGVHSEVVYEKAIKTALNYGSTNQEIEQLARDIKKTRDEASSIHVIDDYVQATTDSRMKQQAKHGRAQPTKAVRLRGYVKNVVNLIDEGMDQLHLASMPRLDMFLVLLEELSEKTKSLRAEVERIERINRATSEQPSLVH